MNIALIGFRGTGKTTIGKKLAKRMLMDFVDTDREIVKRTGKSIPRIFNEDGEEAFRAMEMKIIEELSHGDNKCIACGGGIVLAQENIENLKKNSTIILLEADEKMIFARIRHDRNRPALTQKQGLGEVREVLGKRRELYEKAADFRVDTTRESVSESVQRIMDFLIEKGMA